jgi:tRNA uridine 5-carbamoylmethylation protein Kti12
MKIVKLLAVGLLSVSLANAQDVMQKSMSMMEEGMTQIQQGFLHNNLELIKSGAKLVKDGNTMFSDKKVISTYLPNEKKHMVNVAENAAKRIDLDVSILELNLEGKAYINAANAYSDILNACARCHSIVRSW